MSLPIFLHSGMQGAPTLNNVTSSANGVFNACLVVGFNSQSVSSASCASGVVTLNFAAAPGFNAKDTIEIVGATNSVFNGKFRVIFAGSNQVTYSVPGAPDGSVAGTLTCKFAPLGWDNLFSDATTGVYRSKTSFTQACLRVKQNSSNIYFRGYESMSAVDAGVNPFPSLALTTGEGIGNSLNGPTVVSWILVGTDQFFYLAINQGFIQFYFGDILSYKPNDAFKCVISGNLGFPRSTYSSNMGYSQRGLLGNVSQSHFYFGMDDIVGTPGVDDINTGGNIIVGGIGFCIEVNTTGGSSVRGAFPGILIVYAKSISATPFFTVLENIPNFSGRLLLIRGFNLRLFAVALDVDWGQ